MRKVRKNKSGPSQHDNVFLNQEFFCHEVGETRKFCYLMSFCCLVPLYLWPQSAVLVKCKTNPQFHSTAFLKHLLQQSKGIIHYEKTSTCSHYCRFAAISAPGLLVHFWSSEFCSLWESHWKARPQHFPYSCFLPSGIPDELPRLHSGLPLSLWLL